MFAKTFGSLIVCALLSGGGALAAEAMNPHLAAARAEAFKGNTWHFPALIMCYSEDNQWSQQIIKTPPASKVFDNLYFVGMGAVTAWVVTTSQGIILIDTLDNTQEAKDYIVAGMTKLGLNPADIKDIIITHGHGDHYGGARYFQDTYPGVHVLMSEKDYDLAEKAAAGPRGRGVLAPKRDMVVTDGQKLTLGDTTVTMYLTPGHTPDTISLLIPVKDKGQSHVISMFGGTASANLTPEFSKKYADSATRFVDVVKAAKVDGYISNHPSLDDAVGKIEQIRESPDKPNPFLVGLDATVRNLNILKECDLYHADLNAKKATQ